MKLNVKQIQNTHVHFQNRTQEPLLTGSAFAGDCLWPPLRLQIAWGYAEVIQQNNNVCS